MSPARINGADLSPDVIAALPADVRKKLTKKTRRRGMPMEEVRSHSIRVLAVIAGLTQVQRARVLVHAEKLNNV